MKTITISFATTILLLLATSATAQTPPPYTVTISMFNDAAVPPAVVDRAEEIASRIFAQSGIVLHWLPCGREEESLEEQSACSQPLFPEHLHVHIVNGPSYLKDSVYGISYLSAEESGTQADVFYSKIARFHGAGLSDAGILLGHAIAHELGHLLLGSNSHSMTGIMRGNWCTEDLTHMAQGSLFFSEGQSRKMKAKLSTFALRRDTSFRAVPSAG